MLYRLTNSLGQTTSIEADYFTQDGAGLTLYDSQGAKLANWQGSEIRSIEPATFDWGPVAGDEDVSE